MSISGKEIASLTVNEQLQWDAGTFSAEMPLTKDSPGDLETFCPDRFLNSATLSSTFNRSLL